MEVSKVFTCPCRPGFTYKDLKSHKTTKMHKAWESVQENKNSLIRSKEYENEIYRLKNRLRHKEDVETALMVRINQLESENSYWKSYYTQNYVG